MAETTGTQNATPQASTEAKTDTTQAAGVPATGVPVPQADQATGNPVTDAAKEALRKFKLKVDGQEVEVDEEELKRGYAHQKAANKRFQEGVKAKKQAEEFIKMLKDDPLKVLSHPDIGHDVRRLAEEYLTAQLEEEMLDPKEKELRQLKKENETYKEKVEREKAEAQAKIQEQLKQKYAKEYSDKFVVALKETGLPPTKASVAKMATYVARAASIGYKIEPLEAAKLVKEDIQNEVGGEFFGENIDIEALIKVHGAEKVEKFLDKLRGFDTNRLKNPNSVLKTPTEQGEKSQRKDPVKRMTTQEWRKYNRGF